MKRILTVLLAAAMIITAAGCSSASKGEADLGGADGTPRVTVAESYALTGGTGVDGTEGIGPGATYAAADKMEDYRADGGMDIEYADPDGVGVDPAPEGDISSIKEDPAVTVEDTPIPDETTPIIGTTEPIDTVTDIDQEVRVGLLTAGEWNDNKNWDFWKKLFTTMEEWNNCKKTWKLDASNRVKVTVTSASVPVKNAKVQLLSTGGTILWQAVTDYTGTAYLFAGIDANSQNIGTKITVTTDSGKTEKEIKNYDDVSIELEGVKNKALSLDLMLVFDTTGSMGDELIYLQEELKNVVERVKKDNENIGTRLSVNFYRDFEDEYVVRSNEFTEDIDSAVKVLKAQEANGGGDYEEAVEKALNDAVNNHKWADDSVKLMFIILDAPPHNTAENMKMIKEAVATAAEKGIRIIPLASSGVDKETEYLMRSMAIATGGTYTFLTDDSGVGGEHMEPSIGEHKVEKLNDMFVRIIGEYLG